MIRPSGEMGRKEVELVGGRVPYQLGIPSGMGEILTFVLVTADLRTQAAMFWQVVDRSLTQEAFLRRL